MPKYCQIEAIKIRLASKVPFADPGSTDPNKMTAALLNALISEAESQLEIDLMMRYDVPFRAVKGSFENLPDTSKTTIRLLAELLSVIRVLETDFGRGTSANGEKYTEKLQKRYDALVAQLVELKKSDRPSYQTWLRPPMPGLALAYCNQGDTGFRGRIHDTTTIHSEGDYAYKQINSPGENLFNGFLDPLDRGDPHGGK